MWGQWYDLSQAAGYLRLKPEIIEQLAEAGMIRGSKKQRGWEFNSDTLDQFERYAKRNEEVAAFLALHRKPIVTAVKQTKPPGTPKRASSKSRAGTHRASAADTTSEGSIQNSMGSVAAVC